MQGNCSVREINLDLIGVAAVMGLNRNRILRRHNEPIALVEKWSLGGGEPLGPVQRQTGTNAWHWSRFDRPGSREALVPVGLGALVPVRATNRD